MFALDGLADYLEDDDLSRRNTIAKLIQDWGLCKIVGSVLIEKDESTSKNIYSYPETMKIFCPLNKIKILNYNEKFDWNLITKYSIGKKFDV